MRAVVGAEWIKIRTVRSAFWTLFSTVVVSVGLSFLVGLSFRDGFSRMAPGQRATFDPLFATFYSLTLGQLPLVVFGVLVVTSEYRGATIGASLAAVPRRGVFYAAKLIAATLPVAGVSVITVLATFGTAQTALGPLGVWIGAGYVVEAITGGCLYLIMIFLFAVGVATMLRSSVRALAILLPLLFLGSQGLGNVPKIKALAQYLPDQAGMVIMHLAGPSGDPRFARPYGAWTGLAILSLWTTVSLVGGYLVLRSRDADA